MLGLLGFGLTSAIVIIASILNFLMRKNRFLGNYKSFILFYVFVYSAYCLIFNGLSFTSTLYFGGIYLVYTFIFAFHDLISRSRKAKFSTFSKCLGYSLIIFAFVYAFYNEDQQNFVAINLFLYGFIWLVFFGYGLWNKVFSHLKFSQLKEKISIESNDEAAKNNKNNGVKKRITLTKEQLIISLIIAVVALIVLSGYVILWIKNSYVLTFVLWGSLAIAVIGTLITLLILERKKKNYKTLQKSLLVVIGVLLVASIGVQVRVSSMNKAYLKAEKALLVDLYNFQEDSDETDVDYDEMDAVTDDLKKMQRNNTGKYQNDLIKQSKKVNDLLFDD